MAPSHSRQLLVWTFPTIAILLSYLWFKRKRIGVRSDPGGISVDNNKEFLKQENKTEENCTDIPAKATSTPEKKFSRSLSGVETAPIDIIIPRELRSVKSNPVVISDEDLDLEIEKIKSMKNDQFNRSKTLNNNNSSSSAASGGAKEKSFTPKATTTSSVKNRETVNTVTEAGKSDKVEMMAQDIACVEQKLSNLKLGIKEGSKKKGKSKKSAKAAHLSNSSEHEELQRQSSERDSANHSPADVMLASPSLSSISDNHSEGSNDSGKGGSDVATPPSSRTPAGDGSITDDVAVPIVYEFLIPQNYVGRLIGRHGCFVTEIKEKAHAHILIKKHPTNIKMKVCAVEGTQLEIDNALLIIREKFPLKRYPEMTLEQVSFVQPISTLPLMADHLYLKLIEGINNDTILSCMVTPGHLFLQQPTHPTFPNLNVLGEFMNLCYSDADSPLLPKPIPENTVCVAHSVGAWYRAMILSTDDETDMSYIKFLDYGGYAYVENSKLRQIRGDFLLLPFQAAECYLADIRPAENAESWPQDAYTHIAEMTKGTIIYTQIVSYTEDGIPLVHCYMAVGPQDFVLLNEDLVNRGYAEWIPQLQAPQDGLVEGAVGGVEH